MTDLMHPLVTHASDRDTELADLRRRLADARDEITRLTERLHWVEQRRSQAEERLIEEQGATGRAEKRAESESQRADGAEGHLTAVLIEHVVEPRIPSDYPDMTEYAAWRIAEELMGDLNRGVKATDLDPSGHIQGWMEGLR